MSSETEFILNSIDRKLDLLIEEIRKVGVTMQKTREHLEWFGGDADKRLESPRNNLFT